MHERHQVQRMRLSEIGCKQRSRTILSCRFLVVTLFVGLMLVFPHTVIAVPNCGTESDDAICNASNPYPCCDNNFNNSETDACDGNCTWWAWESACKYWHVGLPTPTSCPGCIRADGYSDNAGYWAECLGRAGYPVSSTPSVNTIAVMTKYGRGHVAWVVGVSSDQRTITVSEMNCRERADHRCSNPGGSSSVRTHTYETSYFDGGFIGPKSAASAPSLTIDGKASSQKRLLETFTFVGSGFTPGAIATQSIQGPTGPISRSSTTVSSDGRIAWQFTPPCSTPLGSYTIWCDDSVRGSSNRVTEIVLSNPACSQSSRTATVLVMDVSGSMGQSWQGGVKIESAKEAALQFINHVEQENLTQGTEHWIGVVGFSSGAHLLLPLTNNYNQARRMIISMSATSATNLGAGLTVGLQEVSRLPGQGQRYVTVLSDGNTNTGLNQSQILSGPVAQARSAKICINTVAFGNKGDVDEDFLRQVARRSGCGRYEYAASGFDLFAAYIKIRHHALGQVISGLSSFGQRVTPIAGRSFSLGTISIPSGQRELQITLGWSESGRLQLRLYDPAGRQVTTSYPGAQIYTSGQFAHAIVTSPMQGIWRVDALPSTSMAGGTEYFAIGSTRPGGIAFALPLPVFTVGDRTFALPGNMPTWALVLVSVVFIAIGVWQLLVDAGLL